MLSILVIKGNLENTKKSRINLYPIKYKYTFVVLINNGGRKCNMAITFAILQNFVFLDVVAAGNVVRNQGHILIKVATSSST